MEQILILGAGTAGTMAANMLDKRLGGSHAITVVDQDEVHYYQPGFLFLPFGTYGPDDVVKPKRSFLRKGVRYTSGAIEELDPVKQTVALADGTMLDYDHLIIATGTHPNPNETPGLESDEYGKTIHDFYTFEGAMALRESMANFRNGRIVMNLIEMPIKCPVAPLEFVFLADSFFTELGVRDKVEIVYVTPMGGVFTKPVASELLGDMFTERNIHLEPDFYLERVDADEKRLVSYDERQVDYDLLVTVPINMGAEFVAKAGIGDELNHVTVDKGNFQSPDYPNIFAIGDAAALPTSKAGSVAHFAMDTFIPNFVEYLDGKPMTHTFDGHANCYIETGNEKAMLIDFNYEHEPVGGHFPGAVGLPLMKESRMNHLGKLMFQPFYWHGLLAGRDIPGIGHDTPTAGKHAVPN